jgi:hypothetical protein
MSIEDELRREIRFAPFIENVLTKNIHLLVEHGVSLFEIEKASLEQDTKEGFDFWLTGTALKIPVRIRKPDCRWRDFTIRWKAQYGGKTEIDKLSEGAGDVYFYAWTEHDTENKKEEIKEWVLIDLHLLRRNFNISRTNRVLSERVRSNGDGTYHTQIKLHELKEAIINGTKKVMKKANRAPRLQIIPIGKQQVLNFGNH